MLNFQNQKVLLLLKWQTNIAYAGAKQPKFDSMRIQFFVTHFFLNNWYLTSMIWKCLLKGVPQF